ncbi:hypothetical protein VB776_17755 [Arcicella sp. DC2W]|uniref:Uncharacterized protein n=1 Tax=Arcicella gelida TaxID=2984195 RepID=A0ABU5S8N9_9BACT|nr:hypothetical protein [Arcicella sp. DC2W]MEA5404784.1 hypothetical protein [Arcicella sp. DC2W]
MLNFLKSIFTKLSHSKLVEYEKIEKDKEIQSLIQNEERKASTFQPECIEELSDLDLEIKKEENHHIKIIKFDSDIEQSEEVKIRPKFLIRKTLWSHVGDGYIVYGGYGNIHGFQNEFDSANKLVNELTYKSIYYDNLKYFDSFNFTHEGLEKSIKNKFREVFKISNEKSIIDLYLWDYNSTIEQANEIVRAFEYPLVSIIEKEDDIFYINMLNKEFWGNLLFYEMIDDNWDFTCHEYFKKHIYNDEETAIKDGVKKILCRLIKFPDNKFFEYLQNAINNIVDKELFQEIIMDFKYYISNEQNYWKMIHSNNIFSNEFEDCFKKIGHIILELKPFNTHSTNYHEATFYNFSGFESGTPFYDDDYLPDFNGIIHRGKLWDMYKGFLFENESLSERKEFWSDRHLLKSVFK